MIVRFVTNKLLWNGVFNQCSVITCAQNKVEMQLFDKELHSTVFLPGPIAILKKSKIDDHLSDFIKQMMTTSMTEKRLDDFFKSSSLYYENNSIEKPVLLKIGNNCQIIPIN